MSFGGGSFFGMDDLSLGQAMFMAEAEGQTDMVDTQEAQFNAAISRMREQFEYARGIDIDVTEEVNEVLEEFGISPDYLSASQLRQIQDALS